MQPLSQFGSASMMLISLSVLAVIVLICFWSLYQNSKKRQFLNYQLQLAQDKEQALQRELAVANQQKLVQFERLATIEAQLHEEQILTAQQETQITHLKELEHDKLALQRESDEYQELLVNANQHITELEVRFSSERKMSEEKSLLFSQARDQLKQDFQYLANKIFEDRAQSFDKDSRASLNHLLVPLREQIVDFKRKVEDVYDKETRDRQALYQQIDHLKQLNQQMSQDALNLTKALKGDSKVQGNWGEVILERILEESGLRKGFEFETQVSLTAQNKRYQPDVIIRLPQEKDMIIDSKVSLTGYERYQSESEQANKEKYLIEHVQSLRNHIRGLSNKSYEQLESINTLDFVMLFVPIEGAFLLALEHDKGLFRYAMQRNIVLVSPSTLLITLRTVKNIWRFDQQNQNAQVIANRGAELYDKFVGFVESMDDLGKHLVRAQTAYDNSYKRLSTGKGNLVSQADALTKLGVNGKKKLANDILQVGAQQDS
ncbi:DNA recombination protein RmuC [Gammaproteobacteria bacterium AS21]|jgi:DNA recombination protein RmuC